MSIVYNILTHLSSFGIWFSQFFSKKNEALCFWKKANFFLYFIQKLRQQTKLYGFIVLRLENTNKGCPIMQALKKEYPNFKLIVSFFSPSGYENKKK